MHAFVSRDSFFQHFSSIPRRMEKEASLLSIERDILSFLSPEIFQD